MRIGVGVGLGPYPRRPHGVTSLLSIKKVRPEQFDEITPGESK